VQTLAANVRFELASLSVDDVHRKRSYLALGQAAQLRAGATSLEDFWRSLEMRAHVQPLGPASIDRAAQLTQKTNQFNLTLHRRTREELERLAADDDAICLTLDLEDRFARHGLIGLGFVVRSEDDPDTGSIDILLLSCRVIGRTAEVHLLSHLASEAGAKGFKRLRGIYVPGPRNSLVADLYPKLGFTPACNGSRGWEYDLATGGPIESFYIADHE
jgi:FkbH-like protein